MVEEDNAPKMFAGRTTIDYLSIGARNFFACLMGTCGGNKLIPRVGHLVDTDHHRQDKDIVLGWFDRNAVAIAQVE
jgi:hypothetical protein